MLIYKVLFDVFCFVYCQRRVNKAKRTKPKSGYLLQSPCYPLCYSNRQARLPALMTFILPRGMLVLSQPKYLGYFQYRKKDELNPQKSPLFLIQPHLIDGVLTSPDVKHKCGYPLHGLHEKPVVAHSAILLQFLFPFNFKGNHTT